MATNRTAKGVLLDIRRRLKRLERFQIRTVTVDQAARGHVADVQWTAAAVAPAGALMCDGAAVSRDDYAALFAAIGETYGAGDGSTTFNVPDLRGRAPVGQSVSGIFSVLGDQRGAETHTLTTAQMPSHTHGPGGSADRFQITDRVAAPGKRVAGAANATGIWTPGFNASDESFQSAATTASSGSGQAHNNVQPSLVLNAYIWT